MEKGSSSSSSSSSSSAGPDSLNGLKFGKKIYFEGVGSGLQPPALPPSPAKKGRTAAAQTGQPPRCQVEGCKLDLTDAKPYYSRHKVCGMHSKSPKVIVAGMEQRFCQQCSRFHQLPEFDQGKRSCRRRLAGHNERRRKPSPGSLLSPRYGSFSPSLYDRSKSGGFVMDFSSSPSLTRQDSWPDPSSELGMGKYNLPMQSSSHNSLSDLLQGTTPPRSSYPDGSFNSSNALSLLSIQPWGSRTRRMSFGATMVQPPAQFGYNQPDGALHEMPPDLGLGQTSRLTEFTGELGLAQPSEGHFHELDHSRGYDTSLQHMHWSL